MENNIVFLDLDEEAVLEARSELRKAIIGDNYTQWMQDLAVDAALERIFNIFKKNSWGAALAEAEARGRRQGVKWQPIETAPKDGTAILLAHEHAAFDGWWAACIGWVDGDTDDMEELRTYEPTHWMPLPSPPLATTPAETQKPETGESALAALEGGDSRE